MRVSKTFSTIVETIPVASRPFSFYAIALNTVKIIGILIAAKDAKRAVVIACCNMYVYMAGTIDSGF